MRIKISKRKNYLLDFLCFLFFLCFLCFLCFLFFYACEITPKNLIYYITIFKYSQPTSEEQQIMESKQLHTERLWAKLPSEYKSAAFLEEFKVKIKKWICNTCPCRFCKKFQPNLGFIN